MDTQTSTALRDYYSRLRESLAAEATIRAELLHLGIAGIQAEYDGVGDSGQIDQICYYDESGADRSSDISPESNERIEALLYALLEHRHGGWENNDGAFGTFRWNLTEGTLGHEHNARYTDHSTSMYQGFEVGRGLPL